MTRVRQPISACMVASFGWDIGVIDSGCISIQNVLLRRGILTYKSEFIGFFWGWNGR